MSFLRGRSSSNSGLGTKVRSLGRVCSIFGLMLGSLTCTPKLPESASASQQSETEQRSKDIKRLKELVKGWRTQIDGEKSAADVEQSFGETLPILNRLLRGGVDTEFLLAYQELSMAIISMYDPESSNPDGILAKVDDYLERNPNTCYSKALLVLILPRIRFGYQFTPTPHFPDMAEPDESPEKLRMDRVFSKLSELEQTQGIRYISENWFLYVPRNDADLHNQQRLVLFSISSQQ